MSYYSVQHIWLGVKTLDCIAVQIAILLFLNLTYRVRLALRQIIVTDTAIETLQVYLFP